MLRPLEPARGTSKFRVTHPKQVFGVDEVLGCRRSFGVNIFVAKQSEVPAGEAIHLRGDVPRRLRNTSDQLALAVWFVVS